MALPPTFEMERLKQDAARLKAASNWGSAKGCAAAGQLFMATMRAVARRDTNRYIRGWQMAMNGASASIGLPATEVVLPVKAASRHSEYLKKLYKERFKMVARIDECRGLLNNWYVKKNRRPDAFYREREAEIRKRTKWLARIDEEINKALGSQSILLFDKGRSKRNFSTVRDKVYGGEGKISKKNGTGAWGIRLHNKEAHCRILEHNYGYVRLAGGIARNGLKIVGAAHGAELVKAGTNGKVRVA